MTFRPALPLDGLAGWNILKRTLPTQQAAFRNSPIELRDEAYFRKNIQNVKTAADLVADPRLLRISLQAFGLEADFPHKAFIRKILSDGTTSDTALSNRLADKRYREFSATFGFGDSRANQPISTETADSILQMYQEKKFQYLVGEQNPSYRLAMNAERELTALANRNISNDAKWFTILGNKPLREFMVTALRIPESVAKMDLDKQLSIFKNRSKSVIGSDLVSKYSQNDASKRAIGIYLSNDKSISSNIMSNSSILGLFSRL